MGLSKDPKKMKAQLANLKPHWKKGQSGNLKGRRPLTMTDFLGEMKSKGYELPSAETISKSWLYISTLPEEELKTILSDKSRPMQQRIIAKGVLDKKGIDVLERIVNRAYGQQQQHIDITSGGDKIKNEPLRIEIIDRTEQVKKEKEEK